MDRKSEFKLEEAECNIPDTSCFSRWKLGDEYVDYMGAPVLTDLKISIGHIFIHRDQVWVRTSEYTAISITENGTGAYYFGKVGDYLRDHCNSGKEYLEFTILSQGEVANLILNTSNRSKNKSE